MTVDDRAQRVLRLCDQLLALPAGERGRFLDKACAGDARLRESVDSVLIAMDQAGNFLEPRAGDGPSSTDLVGQRIGDYEILSNLGEGGMGSVYLAVRRAEGYEQNVAIKFVHGHMLAKELIERFNAERKILAALNHPYIAALIDSGLTEQGVPFIVMEYIDGIPIDEYCDRQALDLRARVRLVQKVATAVQAAHQNLVVHRDLKPSNVLITADGIPKLLDFGIAKLIEGQAAGEQGNTTVFGRQAMTPDYASPEQILENRVTTASDVYTLGVLTYQLLVGERPYHLETGSQRDLIRSVESLTVPRPSTRLTTIRSSEIRQQIANRRATSIARLERALKGDLDNILMMALRQEPERRYGSVAQFSDDLGRYLNQQPVAAHADSVGYRVAKFVQRNWLVVGATAVVILSLAGGVIAYSFQANEAAEQRDIARAEADNARNTVEFLKAVLFAGDPFRTDSDEKTVADVLQFAAENVASQYADDPDTRAAILTALGDIHASRGEYERSQQLSAEAVAVYADQLGTRGNAAADALRVNALSHYYLDDYETADAQFRLAIDTYTTSEDPDWQGLARAYDQLAMVQGNLTDETTAIDFYLLALDTHRQHEVDDDALLISILGNLATEYLQRGDYEDADRTFVDGIEVARRSGASDGQTGMLLANHAGALKNLGRPDEATSKYVEAVDLLERALGAEHPETITNRTSLANHYRQVGDMQLAGATIRRAASDAQAALPEVGFIHSYVQNVGGSILCLGEDVPLGTELATKSLAARRELLPAGHWAISSGEGILGLCQTAAGNFAAAEQTLLKAYADLRDSRGDDHEVTIATRERVAQLYEAWGKPDTALQYGATEGAKAD